MSEASKSTMRAMVAVRYGAPHRVLKLKHVAIPEPRDDQVRIKVCAAGVNAADWRMIRPSPWLIRLASPFAPSPTIQGRDVAGIVDKVGKDVTGLKEGDEVFGELEGGCFAEYVCASEKKLGMKPEGISFEEAACLTLAGVTALTAVRDDGQVKEGDHVMVTGASGGAGSFIVQLVKAQKAQVTATASPSKVEAVKAMGADRVIDYTQIDYTTEDVQYDVILDAAAYLPFKKVVKVLKPQGTYVVIGGSISRLVKTVACGSRYLEKGMKLTNTDSNPIPSDLIELREYVEKGQVKVFLDKTFDLEEAGDAIHYLEERKVIGKVALKVSS